MADKHDVTEAGSLAGPPPSPAPARPPSRRAPPTAPAPARAAESRRATPASAPAPAAAPAFAGGHAHDSFAERAAAELTQAYPDRVAKRTRRELLALIERGRAPAR